MQMYVFYRLLPSWMKSHIHRGFPPHYMHVALLEPVQIRIPKLQVVGEMRFSHDQIDLNQSKTAPSEVGQLAFKSHTAKDRFQGNLLTFCQDNL